MKIPSIKFNTKKLLSLKWKALISISLVLLLINTTFYFLHAKALQQTFDYNQSESNKRNQLAIKALLSQSSSRLQQLGGIIPSLAKAKFHPELTEIGQLSSAIDNIWSSLHSELALDYLGLFDLTSHQKSKWGDFSNSIIIDREISQSIIHVISTESPATLIKCSSVCTQLVVTPLMSKNGTSIGAIVVGQYLNDLVLDFSQLANADISIIVQQVGSRLTASKTNNRYLAAWQATIYAATNTNNTVDVLHNMAQSYKLTEMLDRSRLYQLQSRDYQITMLPFEGQNLDGTGFMVVIYDITSDKAAMQQAKVYSMLIGILGLFLSEIVLLLILWNPLSRLKNTADTLPMLAKSQFRDFRSTISQHNTKTFVLDEIDLLDKTAITLADQLEDMQTQIDKNTSELADNMTQMKFEMNFIHRLLDTAQVVILTQNHQAQIFLLNNHGQQLTGYTQNEISKMKFTDLLCEEVSVRNYYNTLSQIANGSHKHLKLEAVVKCKNGQNRNITWLHSHLESENQEGPSILSVGLDITERKIAEQRITWLAEHDTLTGLYNRRRFHEIVEGMLKLSFRYKHPGALIFLDLDHFKTINDTQGHQTGDIVIKRVANKLTHVLRDTDVIARLGGDEFAVALPEIDADGAITVAKGINKTLNELDFATLTKTSKISASIGISIFPDHGNTVTELLSNADLAMYGAKQRGRGCWHMFSLQEQAREQLEQQMYWQHRIESAIDNNNFVLHFQPILNLRDNSISHYEVLIRMQNNDGSLIAPAPFIEVAEKTGLINDIDHWVLKQTILRLKNMAITHSKVRFALNLSAHAFSDQALLPLLTDLFRYSNINTDNLILEITETAALADFSAACDLISSIKKMGCCFALDDFGVGFSSFYYLQQLPVDYIKIDGSFVRQLSNNSNNQTLVKAITDVARGFGKKTIAEYVEDEATLDILKQYHVDYAQGYFIGKPDHNLQPGAVL